MQELHSTTGCCPRSHPSPSTILLSHPPPPPPTPLVSRSHADYIEEITGYDSCVETARAANAIGNFELECKSFGSSFGSCSLASFLSLSRAQDCLQSLPSVRGLRHQFGPSEPPAHASHQSEPNPTRTTHTRTHVPCSLLSVDASTLVGR